MDIDGAALVPTHPNDVELERLGDEIGPDGRVLPDVPKPPAVSTNPGDAVRARNDAGGVQINAHTAMPSWQGERLDVGWAISVLHPLAAHPLARPPAS